MEYFTLKNPPRLQALVNEVVARRRQQIRLTVREYARHRPGATVESIASELGMGVAAVVRAVG